MARLLQQGMMGEMFLGEHLHAFLFRKKDGDVDVSFPLANILT